MDNENAGRTTLERLKVLFVNKFHFNVSELTPEAELESLGLDSLDKLEFMFDIEEEFKIKIPDNRFKVSTIQDMVAAIAQFISEQEVTLPSSHSGSLQPSDSMAKNPRKRAATKRKGRV